MFETLWTLELATMSLIVNLEPKFINNEFNIKK
jgi:hypothetical protein